jgi:hypothetical protein
MLFFFQENKTATKRHVPITFSENGKSDERRKSTGDTRGAKQSRNTPYTPPSGKYSGKVSKGGGYRSGGGGSGRFRGGRSNRNGRKY